MYKEIGHNSWNKNTEYYFKTLNVEGFIDKNILTEYKQLCEKSRDNKIKDNSTIYLSPISNYPSYKLKNFIEENKLNVSKARKWDKIDTIILDEEFLSQFKTTEELTYRIIPVEDIIKDEKHYKQGLSNWEYIHFHEYLEGVKFFFVEESLLTIPSFKRFEIYPKIKGIPVKKAHGNKKICDNLEFIKNELFENIKKYNLHVVLDSSINKVANKDTVIDLDTYETLYSMLSSTDSGNWEVAREIIANCDYDVSRPYILFLFTVFDILKNKSSNKNYHAVYKRLGKEDIWYKNHFRSIEYILTKNPEYKNVIAGCMKIHLNALYKFDFVKEIISY